ncbi:immunity protein Imm33 domain-containing protein [Balneatrix alpica]|nr:DUF2185 domain-containing protein [Balneatrix alpica]
MSSETNQTKQGFLCMASSLCLGQEPFPVRFMYKTVPAHLNDTGWRLFSGYETDDFWQQPEPMVVVPVVAMSKADASLEALFAYNAGTVWERVPGQDWQRVQDFKIPSEDVQVWISNDVDEAKQQLS